MKHILSAAAASLLCTFTISTAAHADLSGHWSGHGTVTSLQGQTSSCGLIEVTMTQSPGHLTTQRYKADCTTIGSEWGPDPMTIQGETVLNVDGNDIGTLRGDVLETKESIRGYIYTFNLQPVGATEPTVKSTYAVTNFLGTMTISGDLKLVP